MCAMQGERCSDEASIAPHPCREALAYSLVGTGELNVLDDTVAQMDQASLYQHRLHSSAEGSNATELPIKRMVV